MRLRAGTNPVLETRSADASPMAGNVASHSARNQMAAALGDRDFINRVFSALELVGITDELANLERVEAGQLMAGADRSVAAAMAVGASVDPLEALADTPFSAESRA